MPVTPWGIRALLFKADKAGMIFQPAVFAKDTFCKRTPVYEGFFVAVSACVAACCPIKTVSERSDSFERRQPA